MSAGSVSVNGRKIPGTIALFLGDTVQTGENTQAALTATGASVLIFSQTTLTYGGDYLQMDCGALALNGSALTVRVVNLAITPESQSSKIDITRVNGKLEIGAREGSVIVDDGKDKAVVATGKSLVFNSAGCDRKQAGVPAPNTGAVTALHVSNALLYAIGATAAGAAILLLLNTGGGAPQSPPPPLSASAP